MNEQLTLQSTQHEETKTVPLRRRKACLAGAFALFASIAVGIFFGAGFGVLAYAAFLAVAALICSVAFGKVK